MNTGDCASVMHLPGSFLLLSAEGEKFVYRCRLAAGSDFDGCIAATHFADDTWLPLIRAALRRNPPSPGLYDTNLACLSALQRLEHQDRAGIAVEARDWGQDWRKWVDAGAKWP
jgi:hypothetical protein